MSNQKQKHSVIDQEVTRIYDRDGSVKPSVLVEESRPTTAPLHKNFEWNNKKAGAEYRLHQSRKIIRVATIISSPKCEHLINVPSILSKGEGQYKPASVIIESIDEFTAAMDQCLSRLKSAQHAVKELDRMAKKKGNGDTTIAKISVALQALETANNALIM